MDDKSSQEKEVLVDNSKRLSESRPILKPVLVKNLLADVDSEDESDDQAPCSEESEEECDELEGLQPLPYYTENLTSKSQIEKTDVDEARTTKQMTECQADIGIGKDETIKKVETTKISDASIKVEENRRKSAMNTYFKDVLKISGEPVIKSEGKLLSDRPNSAIKRKSYIDSVDKDNPIAHSQWQRKSVTSVDQIKHSVQEQTDLNNQHKSYSPEIKHHSLSTANHVNEVKDKVKHFESYSSIRETQESHVSSSSTLSKTYSTTSSSSSTATSITQDDKVPSQTQVSQANNPIASSSQAASNVSQKMMETPMKIPQGPTRPNPCNSHRNIFQTPQSKINHDLSKNPAQTPATIFSHWSQHHMAQTPMNNHSSARESVQTPATKITQSQSSRHTPRYHAGENKSVRRPLADSMFSAPSHGPQLPKLPELPHESQPSPSVTSRDNATAQDNVSEKKPLYSSSQMSYESKENRNPNPHETIRNENYGNSQVKLSQSESRHSVHSKTEIPKVEYANAHQNNMYGPARPVERQESYQVRENQSMPATSQESRPIQCSIPQQMNMFNPRQNKIITVKKMHYLVLGILGHGMSCEVVRAQDLATLEMRAIKCVDLSKMEKETVTGCLQEICMLDKLRAPCIVNMYSFEIIGASIHVVMEIGDTDLSRLLKSMLQEKKQIPLTMILYYWTEMLTAVKHIHDNGVIHSDLKPANFLLVRGRLKLIDFGIASSINADMTSVVKNSTCGTLNYISPEALVDVSAGNPESPNHNKYKLSYKSDIWSLGCILYSLVYNVTPFNHIRQTWAKVSAITDPKHKISFPKTTGSQPVPLILIDVMNKCLQRDPKARPTVAELLEISYLQSSSPHAAPSIPSQILYKIKRALSDEEWKELIEVLDKNPKIR